MTNITLIMTLTIEFFSKLSSFAVIVCDTFVGLHIITEL